MTGKGEIILLLLVAVCMVAGVVLLGVGLSIESEREKNLWKTQADALIKHTKILYELKANIIILETRVGYLEGKLLKELNNDPQN